MTQEFLNDFGVLSIANLVETDIPTGQSCLTAAHRANIDLSRHLFLNFPIRGPSIGFLVMLRGRDSAAISSDHCVLNGPVLTWSRPPGK